MDNVNSPAHYRDGGIEEKFIRDWNEGKVRRVSDGKRMVPEREWQNLTDEEMMQSYVALKSVAGFYSLEKYARDIEAKLKEKNSAT